MSAHRTYLVGLTLFVLAVCASPAFSQTGGADSLAIGEAARFGLVTVRAEAIGGSTGDTVVLHVGRLVPELLKVHIPAGTVFESSCSSTQSMVAIGLQGKRLTSRCYRPVTEILLSDDSKHAYIIEACCLDYRKDNPQPGAALGLGAVDQDAARIVFSAKKRGADARVIQIAIWVSREHPTDEELARRFRCTQQELEEAREILRIVAAENTGASTSVTVTVEAPPLTGPDDEAIRATGYGASPAAHKGTPQGRLLAIRAAELDAKRRLAERIAGMEIGSESKVQKLVVGRDEIASRMTAFLRGAKVKSVTCAADGTATVVVELRIAQLKSMDP